MNTNLSIYSGENFTMGTGRLLACVSKPLAIFSFAFYTVIFCLGISGNAFIIATVVRNSKLHTPFNYLVVNLAISDICVFIFSLPIAVFGECLPWPLGKVGCRLLRPCFFVFTGVSVCTMMTLSFERYRAVTKPLATKLTSEAALRVIVLIWILAYLIFGLPRSFVFGLTTEKGTLQCDPVNKNVIRGYATLIWRILSTLAAPCIVVCCTYVPVMRKLRRELDAIENAYASRDMVISRVKQNAKTMRLLVTIIIGFLVCFFPFNVIMAMDELIPAYQEWPYNETVESITRMLQVSYSCFNPIILCLMSLDFRHALMTCFPKCLKCGNKVYSLSETQQQVTSGASNNFTCTTVSCHYLDTKL